MPNNAQFIPGTPGTLPGWDIDGDGQADIPIFGARAPKKPRPTPPSPAEIARKKQIRTQEVKQLNQYQGYFTTPEGDFPVTVVANSIKEAAKILTMPGVFGDNVTEPTTIKFLKGKVAVSVPVHHVGFNTVIEPEGAEQSGAYATPAHAEVHNGTEVIFTAFEPFGWKFLGWYKGDQCLSTDLIAYIEVYDPYSTLVQYVAKYEFDPTLRNGRYLALGSGLVFDFIFDGYMSHDGRCVLNGNNDSEYYFVIPKDGLDQSERTIRLIKDEAISQGELGLTLNYATTPVGITIEVVNVTEGNDFNIRAGEVIALKWIIDPQTGSFNGQF
jgi:hypothetical protein